MYSYRSSCPGQGVNSWIQVLDTISPQLHFKSAELFRVTLNTLGLRACKITTNGQWTYAPIETAYPMDISGLLRSYKPPRYVPVFQFNPCINFSAYIGVQNATQPTSANHHTEHPPKPLSTSPDTNERLYAPDNFQDSDNIHSQAQSIQSEPHSYSSSLFSSVFAYTGPGPEINPSIDCGDEEAPGTIDTLMKAIQSKTPGGLRKSLRIRRASNWSIGKSPRWISASRVC